MSSREPEDAEITILEARGSDEHGSDADDSDGSTSDSDGYVEIMPGAFDEADHRGAFGDYGGESTGLIERTFRERIVLVGVTGANETMEETKASLDELAELVDSAGADALARVIQRRRSPDVATYVGKGKVKEIKELSQRIDSDTVVFDDELTPAQQFNLEKILGRTALDRTAVILDIFAQNAHSKEGKAQVELAQLRYRLPRLRRKSGSLSQQGGGIGTRGPGETQLEVDRRRLVRRMHQLEAELRHTETHRHNQRKGRNRTRFSQVSLVGYTNAGKSTLLNRLTDSGVLAEDRLFATLDATTRRLELPGGERVLMTDTVGFVRKLPHQLVDAFKSTLDSLAESDLLIHVVDASAVDPLGQMEAVRSVLKEIGAGDVAELIVFNKADLSPSIEALVNRHPGSVGISAAAGTGIDELLRTIGDRLRIQTAIVELHIPFDRGDMLAAAHREGEVIVESADDAGFRLRVRLDEAGTARLADFVVD